MASETILSKEFEMKSQRESKMSKAKEIIFAWSQSVDINCYTKMMDYRPNYKIQFIWLIILLGSTAATFYFIAKSLIDYFGYEVVSKTNVVYEIPTQFPTVTFCDNNPFSTYEAQAYMDSTANSNGISSDSNLLFLTQLNASSPSTTNDMRKNFGLNLSQITCTYNYTDCRNDLHWYWSFQYGNCYQFNSGLNLTNQNVALKETYRNGKDFGLSIIIDLIDKNKYISSNANGLVVYVHNSSFQPSEEINVEPGKLTSIRVKRTFVEKQPSPYSDCIELTTYSSFIYDYIINSGEKYRQQDCFELCLQKLAIEQCKCYFTGYQNLSTQVRPCSNLTDYDCLLRQYFSFNVNECQTNYCPLECNSVTYDLTLSSLEYPSQSLFQSSINTQTKRDYFQRVYNETLTLDAYKSRTVSFVVYYPNLQYTIFTESPKTSVADLFSQIGGSLGMFVSFSIFTLFELCEIVILIIYNLLFKNELNKVSYT